MRKLNTPEKIFNSNPDGFTGYMARVLDCQTQIEVLLEIARINQSPTIRTDLGRLFPVTEASSPATPSTEVRR